MDDIKIIKPSPDMWEIYRDMRLRALYESPEAFGQTWEELLVVPDDIWIQLVERIDETNHWLFFAFLEGKVIGLLSGRMDEKDSTIASIHSLFVSENARGQGIGKKLLKKLLDSFKKAGQFKKVKLEVVSSQEIALNLYKSFEFEIVDDYVKITADGRIQKRYIMERVLG